MVAADRMGFNGIGRLVPNFTEARVNQFLGFRSQMSHLPTISDTRAPAILGTTRGWNDRDGVGRRTGFRRRLVEAHAAGRQTGNIPTELGALTPAEPQRPTERVTRDAG
jgi:hypothetical protein